MQISVRTFEGKSITVDVQPNDTVRSVKKQIQSKERIRVDLQRLMFGNEQLHNNKTLSTYGIREESTLHLVLRAVQNSKTIAGGYGIGAGTDQLCYPYGLVIDDDQTMIIADYGNHRIIEWKIDEKNGRVLVGEQDQGNQLSYPTDVAIDKQTNSVIICDRGNRRVVRCSRQDGIIEEEALLEDIACWGLAIDHTRRLYVSDVDNHEIKCYNMEDRTLSVVAGGNGRGVGLHQLNHPTYIFVTPQQTLYVSDTWNHRVMKWDKDAVEGTVVGRGFPRGVVVDASDNVYVADYGNHQLIRWAKGSSEGTIIASGSKNKDEEDNQLYYPWGLALDQRGHVIVTDHLNHRVQRFSIE